MREPRSQKTFSDDMIKIFRKKADGASVVPKKRSAIGTIF
jgi:hypothetical protein